MQDVTDDIEQPRYRSKPGHHEGNRLLALAEPSVRRQHLDLTAVLYEPLGQISEAVGGVTERSVREVFDNQDAVVGSVVGFVHRCRPAGSPRTMPLAEPWVNTRFVVVDRPTQAHPGVRSM